MRACCLLLALSLALGATAGSAASMAAPPKAAVAKAEAAKEFKAGVAAFKRKQYIEAAEHFEKAYLLAPHPSALWNAADAREKAGELANAANLYSRFLDVSAEKDKERYEARQRINHLTLSLGRIELSGPDATDIKIDRGSVPEGLATVFVDPGDHVVSARVEGKLLSKSVSVPSGAKVMVRLVPQAEPKPEPARAAADPLADKPAASARKGLGPGLVYAGAGLTAVLAGVTLWSGLDTRSKRNAFESNPTAQVYDEGVSAQTRTNILLGTTAAVAAATVLVGVFAVQWRTSEETQVSLTPGGASFSMRF
jgi:hypothetical protein